MSKTVLNVLFHVKLKGDVEVEVMIDWKGEKVENEGKESDSEESDDESDSSSDESEKSDSGSSSEEEEGEDDTSEEDEEEEQNPKPVHSGAVVSKLFLKKGTRLDVIETVGEEYSIFYIPPSLRKYKGKKAKLSKKKRKDLVFFETFFFVLKDTCKRLLKKPRPKERRRKCSMKRFRIYLDHIRNFSDVEVGKIVKIQRWLRFQQEKKRIMAALEKYEKRICLITEFKQKDTDYVKYLKWIRDHYYNLLKKEEILDENELKLVFSNFFEVLKNSEIVNERIIKDGIGGLISAFGYLRVNTKFISNLSLAMETYKNIGRKLSKDSNKLNIFRRILKEAREKQQGLNFENLMIKPFQHIISYMNIVRSILKCTPNLSFKFLKIQKLLKDLKDLCSFVNQKTKVEADSRKMENLGVSTRHRKLISESLSNNFCLFLRNPFYGEDREAQLNLRLDNMDVLVENPGTVMERKIFGPAKAKDDVKNQNFEEKKKKRKKKKKKKKKQKKTEDKSLIEQAKREGLVDCQFYFFNDLLLFIKSRSREELLMDMDITSSADEEERIFFFLPFTEFIECEGYVIFNNLLYASPDMKYDKIVMFFPPCLNLINEKHPKFSLTTKRQFSFENGVKYCMEKGLMESIELEVNRIDKAKEEERKEVQSALAKNESEMGENSDEEEKEKELTKKEKKQKLEREKKKKEMLSITPEDVEFVENGQVVLVDSEADEKFQKATKGMKKKGGIFSLLKRKRVYSYSSINPVNRAVSRANEKNFSFFEYLKNLYKYKKRSEVMLKLNHGILIRDFLMKYNLTKERDILYGNNMLSMRTEEYRMRKELNFKKKEISFLKLLLRNQLKELLLKYTFVEERVKKFNETTLVRLTEESKKRHENMMSFRETLTKFRQIMDNNISSFYMLFKTDFGYCSRNIDQLKKKIEKTDKYDSLFSMRKFLKDSDIYTQNDLLEFLRSKFKWYDDQLADFWNFGEDVKSGLDENVTKKYKEELEKRDERVKELQLSHKKLESVLNETKLSSERKIDAMERRVEEVQNQLLEEVTKTRVFPEEMERQKEKKREWKKKVNELEKSIDLKNMENKNLQNEIIELKKKLLVYERKEEKGK